jgi:serine/threonine protein kinase
MRKTHLMKKRVAKGKNAYDCVMEELKVLQRLQHPNVIWLHEIIDDPKKDKIFLVTELQKGTITPMSGKERLYFIDMLKALNYCHVVAKVIHRDIKPDNIMLNHNDEAVLIDFGVSEICEKQEDLMLDSNMGSYMFYAPEMFNMTKGTKVHGEKTDLWALGITFYYLLTGEYPWKTDTPLVLKEMVCNDSIDLTPIKNLQARDLISLTLKKDPNERATLQKLMKHPWITNNGKNIFVDDYNKEFGNI